MTTRRNADYVYHGEWRKEHPVAIRGETGTIDGRSGEHILISPPLVATREEPGRMLELFDESVGAVAACQRRALQADGLNDKSGGKQ